MAVVGPTLGALLVQWFSWQAIFLVNIPLGLLAYVGLRQLPDIPRRSGPFDWTASALSAALFALALFGLESLGGDPMRAALCLIAATLIAWVLRSEEHTSELQSRENLVCRLLLEKKNACS